MDTHNPRGLTDAQREARRKFIGGSDANTLMAGHATWKLLLETRPDVYAHHEAEEARFRDESGKDVAILRDRRGGTTKPLTLAAFRKRVGKTPEKIDLFDWGGCGCMEASN